MFKRSTFLIIALISVLAFLPGILVSHSSLFDFLVYRESARHLLSDLNPYKLPHYADYIHHYHDELKPNHSQPPLQNWGHPITILLMLPFATETQYHSMIKYVTTALAVIVACLFLCFSLFRIRLSAESMLLIFLLFPLGSLYDLIFWGGMGWISMAGIVIFLFLWKAEKYFLAGNFLLLCFFRPHLCFLPICIITIWSLRHRCLQILYGACFSFIAASLILIIIQPKIYLMYFEMIAEEQYINFTGASLPSILKHYFPEELHFKIIAAPLLLLCLVGTIATWRYSDILTLDKLVVLSLPSAVFLAPYGWGHDYILCLPYSVLCIKYIVNNREVVYPKILLFLLLIANSISIYLKIIYKFPVNEQVSYGVVYWLSSVFFCYMMFNSDNNFIKNRKFAKTLF
jgi:hypothetical protein